MDIISKEIHGHQNHALVFSQIYMEVKNGYVGPALGPEPLPHGPWISQSK